jgi:hypothetical protein
VWGDGHRSPACDVESRARVVGWGAQQTRASEACLHRIANRQPGALVARRDCAPTGTILVVILSERCERRIWEGVLVRRDRPPTRILRVAQDDNRILRADGEVGRGGE